TDGAARGAPARQNSRTSAASRRPWAWLARNGISAVTRRASAPLKAPPPRGSGVGERGEIVPHASPLLRLGERGAKRDAARPACIDRPRPERLTRHRAGAVRAYAGGGRRLRARAGGSRRVRVLPRFPAGG